MSAESTAPRPGCPPPIELYEPAAPYKVTEMPYTLGGTVKLCTAPVKANSTEFTVWSLALARDTTGVTTSVSGILLFSLLGKKS